MPVVSAGEDTRGGESRPDRQCEVYLLALQPRDFLTGLALPSHGFTISAEQQQVTVQDPPICMPAD